MYNFIATHRFWFAVVPYIMFAVAVGLILRFAGRDSTKTVSKHASSTRKGFWLLFISLSIPAIPTYILLIFFIAPAVGLPWLKWFIMVAFICQIIVGAVPDKRGWKSAVHSVAAFGVFGMMWFFMLTVAVFGDVETWLRILAGQFVIVSPLLVYAMDRTKFGSKHSLLFQIAAIADWVVVLMVMTFSL